MLQEILAQLNRVRGVGGCLLVSPEGLTMESALRSDADEAEISARVGEVLAAALRLGQHAGLGPALAFNALSDNGGILVSAAGPAYLVLLVDPGANLALLNIEARPLIERVATRLTT